jgi:hypothetical protein
MAKEAATNAEIVRLLDVVIKKLTALEKRIDRQ